MQTATPAKKTNLSNDLQALVEWLNATDEVEFLRYKIDPNVPASYSATAEALTCALEAKRKWSQIPKKRRIRAESLHDIVQESVRAALDLGGFYSGETTEQIIWEAPVSAYTSQSRGKSYSKNIQWHRTDATHVIHLDVNGLLAMEHNHELLIRSAAEGMPIIALYRPKKRHHDYHAIWVEKYKGKSIRHVSGWVAYDPTSDKISHSTISATQASNGLRANIEH